MGQFAPHVEEGGDERVGHGHVDDVEFALFVDGYESLVGLERVEVVADDVVREVILEMFSKKENVKKGYSQ